MKPHGGALWGEPYGGGLRESHAEEPSNPRWGQAYGGIQLEALLGGPKGVGGGEEGGLWADGATPYYHGLKAN